MNTRYKQCGIYCYHNIVNGKNYVGQSIDLKQRKTRFGNKKTMYSGKIFQNAIKKYGKDKFQYSILTHCKPEELNYFEQFYISRLKTTDRRYGYNCTSGGDSQFFRTEQCKENMRKSWTEERRKKQSEKNKGEKNGNFGNKWNDEQKKHGSIVKKEQARNNFFKLHGFDVSELNQKIENYLALYKNATYADVARHFNINISRASSVCKKYGLTTELSYQRANNNHKKPVVQCDINNHNTILNIFPSLQEATLVFGMKGIKHCVYGHQSHAYGYFWRFATDDEKPGYIDKAYLKPTELYHKMGSDVKKKLKDKGVWDKPHLRKKVFCYDSNGQLYKIYDSVRSVLEDGFSPIEVSHCCNPKDIQRTHRNYVFSYVELTSEEVLQKFIKHVKIPIIQLTTDNVFVRKWESATEAGKELNLFITNINRCCHGKAKTCGGYKWGFEKDFTRN